MTKSQLVLGRAAILAHRRAIGSLDERLPAGGASLRRAAWAGLQDSMPRAALLSIHARVDGTTPTAWEDPALVQVWGPRYSAYVVAAADLAVFTLGRLPDQPKARRVAEDMAARLDAFLAGQALRHDEAGVGAGVRHANALRYGAPTGRILIRWDGARQPTIWTMPPPSVDVDDARRELARRYLHVFGPATADGFAAWAGVSRALARDMFAALGPSLVPVRTPIGDGWILAGDEASFRAPAPPTAAARLLPSGDAYFLLHGADRELLVRDPGWRALLWTSRVWPGAVLVEGEIVGTWRRTQALVTVAPWRALTATQRQAIEMEAASMPLPGLNGPMEVRWAAEPGARSR
ncbi:MAG: winged helix DNA-binding domain-containing protein [Chloroflexi bacterium]|nr:winged helix DNA-binding domain-containing protein [Chloroflexota bacterium]